MSSISERMRLMPTGVRFHPTNKELVNAYLKPKNRGRVFQLCVIPQVDVCDYEPWDLPHVFEGKSEINTNKDQEWFFFSPLHFKYSNSDRVNRTTKSGFWKPTGKDREIMPSVNMRILVFHTGRGRIGVKTNWVIHEYYETEKMPFVVCHLKKNAEVKNKKKLGEKTKATMSDEVEPSSSNASDVENSVPELPVYNQQEPSVADVTFSNGQSQIDNAEEYLAWNSLNADLFLNSSIALGDKNSQINNQKEPSVVGLPSANACSDDCNEMQSELGTTDQQEEDNIPEFPIDNQQEEDTIPEFPIDNQQEEDTIPEFPTNACNDDFNWMQSQLGTTEREEDLTEFCKGFISLDDLDKEITQYISKHSSTLESLGKVDNGGISSATHSGTAQTRLKRKVELFPLLTVIIAEKKETVFLLTQLHYVVLPLDKEWTMAGFTNAKKGLNFEVDNGWIRWQLLSGKWYHMGFGARLHQKCLEIISPE